MNMGRDLRELLGGGGARNMGELLRAAQAMGAALQQREAELRVVRGELAALQAEKSDRQQESERMRAEDERARLRRVSKRPESSSGATDGPEGSEEEQEGANNNQESHEDADEGEDAVQEKLQLLAQLHRLKREVESQTSALLEERARFAEQKEDLELSLEEAEQRIAEAQGRETELASEKQFAEEKYDFLHTELDLLRQDQEQLKVDLRKAEDATAELQQTLDETRATHQLELISLRTAHQAEREQLVKAVEDLKVKAELDGHVLTKEHPTDLQDIQLELAAIADNMVNRESEVTKLHEEIDRLNEALFSAHSSDDQSMEELEKKLESFTQTSMILKQQLGEKEEEVATLRVKLKDKDKALQASASQIEEFEKYRQNLIQEHEMRVAKLKTKDDEAQKEIDSLQTLIGKQKAHTEELKANLLAASAKCDATNHELRAVKDERATVLEDLKASQRRSTELERELSMKATELDQVSTDNAHAAALLQTLEKQLVNCQAAHESLVRDLTAAQTRISSQEKAYQLQLGNLTMEKMAVQQEIQQLKKTIKVMSDDIAAHQGTVAELTHQQQACQLAHDDTRAQLLSAHRQLEANERKLMEIEDRQTISNTEASDTARGSSTSKSWASVAQEVSVLGKFLPSLQATTVLLDDALCACEDNASALEVICPQVERDDSSTLLYDVLSFVQFARQLKDMATKTLPGSSRHVRRLHRQVFAMLSHWYEVTDLDEVPAPPVTIASREVAFVLSNWTSNKGLRESTQQWLQYVEGIGSSAPVSTQLRTEGITRLIKNLTMEVKQGFLMMILPILRRNPCVFIRVFTRLVSPSGDTSFVTMDARRWEMKIHIQPVTRSASFTVASSVPDSAHFEQSPPSPSSLSSISSATSSTTSSRDARLQIINEKLQSMQNL